MGDEKNKKGKIQIYVEPEYKEAVDDCIMEKKIRNFQECYRKIFEYGFTKFKEED